VYHSLEEQQYSAEQEIARNFALSKLTDKEKELLGLK